MSMMLSFQELTSVKNPHIVSARELASRKGREAQRAFLCEGEHMALEALAVCPQAVRSVFVDAEKREKYEPLLKKALQAARPGQAPEQAKDTLPALYAVPSRVMEAMGQVKTPQGIAAVVSLPAPAPISGLGKRLILLENVQDPGNVGTILRTLDAAGFGGCVLTPGCADPFAPKALRATMGSIFRVPMVFTEDGDFAMRALKEQGYALLAAGLSGEPFYERGPLPDKLCLMIGNEGAGLTEAALGAATHCFRLPMEGGAESLNAAIAAGIMMYDLSYR